MLGMRGMELKNRRSRLANFTSTNITLDNNSFESPSIGSNSFVYQNNDFGGWTRETTTYFGNHIIGNGSSAFGVPTPYPNLSQCLILQATAGQSGIALSRTITIPSNCRAIRCSCFGALRFNNSRDVFVRFYLNNTLIGDLTITTSIGIGWRQIVGQWYLIPQLSNPLFKLELFAPLPDFDMTAFIDNIVLEGIFQ